MVTRLPLRALAALAGVLVAGNVVAWLVGPEMTPPLEHHSWIAEAKQQQLDALDAPCTDLAIIGSSVGLMGLSPHRLLDQVPGLATAYNAALGGSFVGIDARWYRSFVEPALHPRTVVHVVALPSLSTDREGAREIWAAWRSARASATGPLAEADRALSDLVPVMRYRSRLSDPEEWVALAGGTLPEDRLPDPQLAFLDDLGFMARPEVGDAGRAAELEAQIRRLLSSDGEMIEQAQLDELRELLAEHREHGVAAVLVLPPVSRTHLASLVPDIDRFRAEMASLAAEAGVLLIDASDLDLPVTAFWDGVHLNAPAAERFTDQVASELQAAGAVQTCPTR